jgi:hypothetical protein
MVLSSYYAQAMPSQTKRSKDDEFEEESAFERAERCATRQWKSIWI